MPTNSTGTELHDELGGDTRKVSDEGIVGVDEEKGPSGKPTEVAKGAGVDEVDKGSDAAPKAKPLPKTKAGMVQAAYDKLNAMKKDDVKKTVEKMMYEAKDAEAEDEDEEDEDDESTSEYMKERKKGKKHHAKEDFDADLNALVESEATLSEGFKEKAEVIFEAAVKSKVSEHVENLEEQYTKELAEETDRIQNEMVESVNGYLDYVVENWMEENKLAIENGLRAEIAESFMGSLKNLFAEHYVEVPDSKVDLVDELAKKNESLEEELNSSVKRSIRLNEKVKDLTREKVIREAAADLTETQAEKLRSLAEDMEFDSVDTFEKKIDTLKESYFSGSEDSGETHTSSGADLLGEEIESDETHNVSDRMASYLDALSRSNTK